MPIKGGKLTHQERNFARHLADTGDATYAATKAGYGSPAKRGSEKANDPAIAAEAQRIAAHALRTAILPQAIKRHLAVLNDDRVTGQTLNNAIALAYKYGLAEAADGTTKDAADMTPEELGRAIAALTRAREDAARPILDLDAEELEPVADPPSILD